MKIEIIAELAQGFEGCPEQSRLLIKAASVAGADAAKFQLVFADELATPDYKFYNLFKSLEMPDDAWIGLGNYAAELGIQLQLDIFGARSLALAQAAGVDTVKLHGTDIANVGLLKQVASSNIERILLGAGGAHFSELEQAIEILSDKRVVILLGFQGYPTPDSANQVDRVRLLSARIASTLPNVVLGFADHAMPDNPLRYAIPAMAIGAGATVLEKHLTLGKVMKLEDHEAALNPDEFFEFTQTMRVCADALGVASEADDFGMSESESSYRKVIRRHVVACRNLESGAVVMPSDLTLKRSSSEQVITNLSLVYHKTIKRRVQINTPVSPEDIL